MSNIVCYKWSMIMCVSEHVFMLVHVNFRWFQQVPSGVEASPGWTWGWAPCSVALGAATCRLSATHLAGRLKCSLTGSCPVREEAWGRTPLCPAAAGVWGWPWTGSEGRPHAHLEEEENIVWGLFEHTASNYVHCFEFTMFSMCVC